MTAPQTGVDDRRPGDRVDRQAIVSTAQAIVSAPRM